MSKVRSGQTFWSVCRDDQPLLLDIDWTYEESEYGDGSTDWELEYQAKSSRGLIELTEREELLLKEKLEDEGELI